MKKILFVNFCNGLYGGIESFLFGAFECLDKSDYYVTFLTCGKSSYGLKREEIIRHGGKIDTIPILANNNIRKIRLYFALKQYIRVEKPDIIHINSGTISLLLIASIAARKEHCPQIICHAHNFDLNKKNRIRILLRNILKKRIFKTAHAYLACSLEAAHWIFPSHVVEKGGVIIIPNGIDTAKFKYDEAKRIAFRNKLGISNELIIGNIGRFQGQKNHKFMIEIMKEVLLLRSDVKLLLVGVGELRQTIEQQAIKEGVYNHILFLGERNDIDVFLSAIDVFILPSLYEGLGIVAIEAQAAGARTIVSTTLPPETNVTGNIKYLPIYDRNSAKIWAQEICKCNNHFHRIAQNHIVYEAGYDIHDCYKRMFDIYMNSPK